MPLLQVLETVVADRDANSVLADLAQTGVDSDQGDPFLSVLVRTQGRRPALAEALDSLVQQDVPDFEVLVLAHRTTASERSFVDRCVREEGKRRLRGRTRVIDVNEPGRAAPLNRGLELAAGRYAAVLDDDDFALPTWVSTFANSERDAGGRIIRSAALVQDVDAADVGRPEARSEPAEEFPRTFDLVDHLRTNYTPNFSVAFPRQVYRTLGLRFDETLTTTEDWDFLVRAAALVGVHSVPVASAVYRRSVCSDSSASLHDADEWASNAASVRAKFARIPLVLGAGSSERLHALLDERDELARRAVEAEARLRMRRSIDDLLDSGYWRVSALLCAPWSVLRGRPQRRALVDLSAQQLAEELDRLRGSRAGRAAERLRGIATRRRLTP